MPHWVTNELTIAGPRKPVETLDAELWNREQAAKDGNGLRFDVAVPAVPADTEWIPGYPGGDFGDETWGCRAVGHAGRHERIVTDSTKAWVESHPYLFYFGLEDFVYHRAGKPHSSMRPPAHRRRRPPSGTGSTPPTGRRTGSSTSSRGGIPTFTSDCRGKARSQACTG